MTEIVMRELVAAELDPYRPLLGEIECGRHFSVSDPGHVAWLNRKIAAHLATGVQFIGCGSRTGEPLGLVGLLMEPKLFLPPAAEIVDIGVLPPHRRRGFGTELLNYAGKLAQEGGAEAVYVRTYAADTGTIAFYGRNQFHPVAVIPGTNGPDDEGDIVMRRKLPKPAGTGELG